jgi:hypothetical protein
MAKRKGSGTVLTPQELWENGSAKEWKETLEREGEAVTWLVENKGGKKKNLPALNEWFYSWTPKAPVPKEDLIKMMDWKLTRNKVRPLMRFIVALDKDQIETATKDALSGRPALEGESLSIDELKSAIEALTVLKGVGTATASALFSRFNPKLFCHMGDQALELTGERTYTTKRYLELVKDLNEKAAQLSDSQYSFTSSEIERAIWASTVLSSGATLIKRTKK